MKKQDKPQADIWNDSPEPVKPQATAPTATTTNMYDLDGLMTDFPTARELEKFVFDETGIVLNLKGRANKLKYQVAMDVLNGAEPAPEFIGSENPYLDKNDLVPVEAVRILPPKDPAIPDHSEVQNIFHSRFVPHPDPAMRANDAKVTVCFRKYVNGMITYEVEGPMEQRAQGEKIDKYGRTRPEIYTWVDPRTPEQIIVRADGSVTPVGTRLKALMQSQRVNDSNVWDTWIDREFVSINQAALDNPWATT